MLLITNTIKVVNPAMKLEWFWKHQPDDLEWAKQLFIREVRYTICTFKFFMRTKIFINSYDLTVRAISIHQHPLDQQQCLMQHGQMTFSVLVPMLQVLDAVLQLKWMHTCLILELALAAWVSGRSVPMNVLYGFAENWQFFRKISVATPPFFYWLWT